MTLASATALKTSELEAGLAVYQVVAHPTCDSGLPALVMKIISFFDGNRNLVQVCEEAQISIPKGEAVVRKLTEMGILQTARTGQSRTRLSALNEEPAFTAEEEAFFASEVEPIDECDLPFESLGEKIELFISDLILRLKGSPVLG